ncbi:MAG: phosphoglycerate mutase family protein [Candidatus Saccharibacteria bacterium]|nr:phosphoglycerate mutase family protein [Candidatus Saccharibacteria bacterium]
MSTLVVRHSLSEANNRNNYGTPAFGHADAPLMPEGRQIAQNMGLELQSIYSITPTRTPAAVSKMLRSQETASEAGFIDITKYEILNEVDTKLPYPELKEAIANQQHTPIALKAAKFILDNPPKEQVWVTHGLVIASLCEVLGISNQFEHFVPKFCEIRDLPI